MSFSAIIKQERERLGITQAQAASMLGVSKSAVEKWESGKRTPRKTTQEGALARLRNRKTPRGTPPANARPMAPADNQTPTAQKNV